MAQPLPPFTYRSAYNKEVRSAYPAVYRRRRFFICSNITDRRRRAHVCSAEGVSSHEKLFDFKPCWALWSLRIAGAFTTSSRHLEYVLRVDEKRPCAVKPLPISRPNTVEIVSRTCAETLRRVDIPEIVLKRLPRFYSKITNRPSDGCRHYCVQSVSPLKIARFYAAYDYRDT